MKISSRSLGLPLLASLALSPFAAAVQTTWSLQDDWSNTSNPNGAWTLTNNGAPFTTQYQWLDGSLTVPVYAWAASPGPRRSASGACRARSAGWSRTPRRCRGRARTAARC